MTREEAIEVLKDIYNYTRFDTYTTNEARNMAIKALENKPRFLVHSDGKIEQIIETCDECVSRQAVLKKLRSCLTGGEIEYRYVKLHIDSIPPVLPKREQGEWCEQNDDYFDWYECSECGYGSEGEMQYSSEHDVRTKYCPNCGAEMR